MLCNLGVGTVALLLKHYVMMKRASVLVVQQTLFSDKSREIYNFHRFIYFTVYK